MISSPSLGPSSCRIGDENVHRVRGILDEIFQTENFVSQIQYRALTPLGSRGLSNVYDYVLWFAKSKKVLKYRNIQLPSANRGRAGVLLQR